VFDDQPARRSVLRGLVAALVAGVAGCTGSPGSTGDANASPETTAAEGGEGDLDLREANVVDAAVERAGDGYRFDVTLHHDDDGEDGYANWWQVETPDGERLGRRELSHAHDTREFTRSATVAVPADVSVVVVRGHDQTHGYGGQAAVVMLPDGETEFVRQGSDRQSLGDSGDESGD